jgi:hypothetical protein
MQGLHSYIEKTLCPKEVPISPGVIFKLKQEDVPELPDQRKLEHYRSFELKLQFAATWVRIDIVFTVSQLAEPGSILCIGRRFAMGSAAPPHGISGGQPELQDYVSAE